MLPDIKNVGKGIVDAIELKLLRKKEVDITIKTNETDCNDNVLDQFKNQTLALVFGVTILGAHCELVDDVPEYSIVLKAVLPDDQLRNLSDTASNAFASRSFDKRRLVAINGDEDTWSRRLESADVSEAFGAQTIQEQGSGGGVGGGNNPGGGPSVASSAQRSHVLMALPSAVLLSLLW